VEFAKGIFSAFWDYHVFFVLYSVYVLYCIYWFAYVELYLYPWNETNSVMVYDLFNVLLNSVCKYSIEIFLYLCSSRKLLIILFYCCILIGF
jgi:hypothetical protein